MTLQDNTITPEKISAGVIDGIKIAEGTFREGRVNLAEALFEIHTTDRSTFKHCRQKWEFSSPLMMNLEPIMGYEPFWFGSAIHDGIAVWYATKDEDAVYDVFTDHIDEWFKSLWTVDDDGNDVPPSQEDYDRRDELGNMGLAMLEQYIGFSRKEDDFEVVWVERAHQILELMRLSGYKIDYSFRCDGLVRDKHGRYWILEHKTTSQFVSNTDYLLMDDQVGTYIWAIQLVLGIKIEGVIYNWIKKKAPRPLKMNKPTKTEPIVFSVDKAQDTTYEIAKKQLFEYWPGGQALPDKYRDFLDFLYHKPNNFVQREHVRRNQKELSILGKTLPFEIKDMVSNPAIYRTPTKLCNTCAFFDPCLLKWEGGDWQELLETNYKKRDPRD